MDYAKIEKQLVTMEQRLVDDMHSKLGNVQNTSLEDPTELLDMAANGEIDYMAALSAEAGSTTIDEIEQALQKLREGTYGVCASCTQTISKRRLKARPFASLCIKCKETQERLGYVEDPSEASVTGDYGIMVDLTDRDLDAMAGSLDEVFRDVEDAQTTF
jgi:RNA polymerase-binding transcription factor